VAALVLVMLALACADDQILLERVGEDDAPPISSGSGQGPSYLCQPAGEGACECPAASSCICDAPEEALCVMSCAEGNCHMNCGPSAAPCDMSCNTDCIMICQANSFCFANCNGRCTMVCEPGSFCELASFVEASSIVCLEGASCSCTSPLCDCSGAGLCEIQAAP
jgi:hypothetical protein